MKLLQTQTVLLPLCNLKFVETKTSNPIVQVCLGAPVVPILPTRLWAPSCASHKGPYPKDGQGRRQEVGACLLEKWLLRATHGRTHNGRERTGNWSGHTRAGKRALSLLFPTEQALWAHLTKPPLSHEQKKIAPRADRKKQRYMRRDLPGNWFCHHTLLTAGPRVRRRWGWRRACPWRRRPSTPPPCRGCTSGRGGSPCRSGRDKIHIGYLRFPRKDLFISTSHPKLAREPSL